MTKFIIELNDDSKAGLLLATLKRLVMTQGIELLVERNGQGIALDTPADDARFASTVDRIIADAIAENLQPLTEKEKLENAAYWQKVGADMDLSDDEIVRLIKEQRAETYSHSTIPGRS